MKRLLVPAAVAAIVASSSFAFAAQATGTIKAIDTSAMTVTLQDGTTYYLPQNFKNPGLKTGEKVQVTWAMENNKHMASAVTVQQ